MYKYYSDNDFINSSFTISLGQFRENGSSGNFVIDDKLPGYMC
jgi:hypothetical protein